MSGHHDQPNVSADLIWEVAKNNNSFLVKRRSGGGAQFSRDPFNLTNMNTRTHAGFVNPKAVGLISGEKGAIIMTTKKTKNSNRPASHHNEVAFGGHRSGPKVYRNIVNAVAKQGYRGDLRQPAVARASALRKASRPAKEPPTKKLRGSKARKAAEEKE